MHLGAAAKPGLPGAGQQLLPRRDHVALQRAAIHQRRTALRMRQTEFGLLPLQLLALALVGHGGIRLNDRHHATVHFDHEHGTAAALLGPDQRVACGRRENLLGVPLGNPPNRALGQHNPIMLHQFVHDLGKGLVRTKVADHPLQRARTAALPHFGAAHKGA
jgi:hypothetical protein